MGLRFCVASAAWGCSRCWVRLQPLLRKVAASVASQADSVAHVSADDSAAERLAFPSPATHTATFTLLRTPLATMQLGSPVQSALLGYNTVTIPLQYR